jgi:MFS family permease
VAALAVAIAVAFADSSIVVLALPELYVRFRTSIVGVSWVITSYNLVVAAAALALAPAPLAARAPARRLAASGLLVFALGSAGCAAAWTLPALLAFRCLQGLGAAALLTGAAPLVGAGVWSAAGAVGVAVGPALGGVLTQAFDWRAIFVAQAPVAAAALYAARSARVGAEPAPSRGRSPLAPNLALVGLFGALVGALFLSVLLVVTVWQLSPLAGAGVVSALPATALVTSRLRPSVATGGALLAAGLGALALLPASSTAYAAPALAVCGAGFGLAVPSLTRASAGGGSRGAASLSVGARHAGLVLALIAIAPVLSASLDRGGTRATENAAAAVLDARLPLLKKVPIALDLRDELDRGQHGAIPDLARPFERAGAGSSAAVRAAEADVLRAIRDPLTRSFRPGFALAALFALASLAPGIVRLRRRRT